ncbi:bifunctional diguanylate cyclase/phosphodiesterase [Actinoplanes bogorensis]|uniref:Bifunctional diguanylate cyclase/phosphodiesterase n=1 Tax=Paractinoplanes bogorensis TaxID=1610840 RepID=A0ABS5YMF7_9ACTN|nr:bifunctional diguanylate cyclase/phosphodiesterase [Actinoplanes bogorensis]MBU2664649.1 bifunctional diguanylate cyclase/phosphodiesterase [Actinoplanes bogorensis]
MRTALLWRWWLAIGLIAAAAYAVVPAGSAVAKVIYYAVALGGLGGIVLGIRIHRPARPAMWYLLAAGRAVWLLGDLALDTGRPFADALFLGSYVFSGLGLLLLVRLRRGSLGEAADASAVATALTIVTWVFLLHPNPSGTGQFIDSMFAATYIGCDLTFLAILIRVLADSSSRTTSLRILASLTGFTFLADAGYALANRFGTGTHGLDAIFLLAYAAWAAGALHPSMAGLTRVDGPVEGTAVGRRRVALFAACALIPPALLFFPEVVVGLTDRKAVLAGSIVLTLLVIVRMAGIAGRFQRQATELRGVTLRDELTGLANRRRFSSELAVAGADRQVVYLGLNGFKNVNDELGRPVGDRVLDILARRLEQATPAGSLVARMGGDEFSVLVAGPAEEVAAGLVGALREPVEAGGHQMLVGVAIGISATGGCEPVEVLRRAEAAMYAAKQTGEPVRVWSPELDEHASSHAQLGAEMRTALDTGQFRVVYQPIVDLETGSVAAVEALVRWEHPERGLVSPVQFVPAAEQNGLIVELGEWILRTSVEQMARWRAELGDAGPGRVSVNVSARQLNRPGFAATVAAALADSGLPARHLTAEVTETAVFEGGQAVIALHELRALGVGIALDDFGTGHSSLGLLQTVPVDTLKVDKSFVDGITEAGRQAVIAESLMHVSTGLGLSAVAEGVETAEQAAALRARGYRLLQGYHFGRPVADPDFDLVRTTVDLLVSQRTGSSSGNDR